MKLDNLKTDNITKTDIEQVQKQKQEYYLLGTFLKTKGLHLFSYNSIKEVLKEIKIEHKECVRLVFYNGVWMAEDEAALKVDVDSRNIHFEALNLKSAKKRIEKFKSGKIKDLCNLKEANKQPLMLF